jgi:hypothetical protein
LDHIAKAQKCNENANLYYIVKGVHCQIIIFEGNVGFTPKSESRMNIEEIREYCLAKPAVTEGFPFNDTALVFKVAGKMFALLDLSEDSRGISLKCDPELAIEGAGHRVKRAAFRSHTCMAL